MASSPLCTCGHFQPFHNDAGCRVNGCRCQGFRDPSAPIAEEEPPKANRRVTFEIPDGFMLTVSLVPYTETAAEPDAPAEEASVG